MVHHIWCFDGGLALAFIGLWLMKWLSGSLGKPLRGDNWKGGLDLFYDLFTSDSNGGRLLVYACSPKQID